MSELTTIWNRPERFSDISEVWGVSGEDGYALLRESREPGFYPKHIVVKGYIGYLIMPGIYYFGESEVGPDISTDAILWNRESAMIAREISKEQYRERYWVMYMAVDRENIEVLRKIYRTITDSTEDIVFVDKSRTTETALPFDVGGPDAFTDLPDCQAKQAPRDQYNVIRDLQENTFRSPFIPDSVESNAEELMPGIGIRDICVGMKCVFLPRIDVIRYEYAYRSGDTLVLINGDSEYRHSDRNNYYTDEKGRKEYDLRILEELTVRRTELLRCGITITRDYHVIDCRAQKIKQVLTPQAYELLKQRKV